MVWSKIVFEAKLDDRDRRESCTLKRNSDFGDSKRRPIRSTESSSENRIRVRVLLRSLPIRRKGESGVSSCASRSASGLTTRCFGGKPFLAGKTRIVETSNRLNGDSRCERPPDRKWKIWGRASRAGGCCDEDCRKPLSFEPVLPEKKIFSIKKQF